MNKWIRYFIGGALIGCANVIPGVSGGTMAVALRIYRELIEALSLRALVTKFTRTILFLGTLTIGAALGISLIARVIGTVQERFPLLGAAFFIGLIVGGIPHIVRSYRAYRFRLYDVATFVVGGAIVLLPTLLPIQASAGIERGADVSTLLLAISGFVASAAMILPGVSGALVLIIFGTYSYVVEAIIAINVPVLIIFALAAGAGILVCAKTMRTLFKKAPRGTWACILGIVVGSVVFLWPPLPEGFAHIARATLVLAAGLIPSYLLSSRRAS